MLLDTDLRSSNENSLSYLEICFQNMTFAFCKYRFEENGRAQGSEMR
jgi:hypothetical protein